MRLDRILFLLWAWLCLILPGPARAQTLPLGLGRVADFHLVERSGRPVTRHDLEGRVWVVDFVYTTCPGPCPLLTAHMASLQKSLHDDRLGFLSISVDPQTDTPAVLTRYADSYHADPQRWWFLTGSQSEVETLLRSSFHVAVDTRSKSIMHSNYFCLVDDHGYLRGYYDTQDAMANQRLVDDVGLALARVRPTGPWSWLPKVNAVLNATSGLLVMGGLFFINRRQVAYHKACMLAALTSSALFLTCYLIYHAHVGSVPFLGPPEVKRVYLAILISHTSLALVTVPLVVTTLSRALRGNFERHVAIARWTYPIWLYVSCTGVVVYVLLYQMFVDGG